MAAQREWFETDFYKVLGVAPESTEKEITRSYRKLAKQYHPDANPGSEERFKEISAAYDVLGDTDKRKEYDDVRRRGPIGGFGGAGAGANGGFNFRVEDLGDIFGGIFNGGAGGGGARSRRRNTGTTGPQRGGDLEAELHLSFQEAVEGLVTTVNVAVGAACHTCGGSGSRPGTMPIVCPTCNGAGTVDANQGLFSLSSPCPECGGRGTKIVDPCPTCFGTGRERRDRAVKVRIPGGVDDGQRIRVKGRGEAGRNGGPTGDLYVTVRVTPHPIFGRKGLNLTLTVPVTMVEATLGADITVPSLDKPVTVRIPPGTKSGKTFRVRSRGLSQGGKFGDLLVTVEVFIPTTVSAAEREALIAFAAVSTASPREYLGL